jgi:hypothetical protein
MKNTYPKGAANHLGQSWGLFALMVIACISFIGLLASF